MGDNTRIEWCDATFNPWIGCQKVSDGCKHCYAESLMDHRYGKAKWGPQGTRQRTSAANWRKPLQWNKQAQDAGIRYRVFCASLADVFENNPQLLDWRQELFALIEQTPNLDWLLLTKRPQHVFDFVPKHWLGGLPSNVWIGASVESQGQIGRVRDLLRVPAYVHFLSCEPMLGPIDLQECYSEEPGDCYSLLINYIDWVIVGGESGQNARPMSAEWALNLRRQCDLYGVKFFMKQLGGHPDKRHNLEQFPPELRVRQFPG